MTDVFISYSQGAPGPTEALAADLSGRGLLVWYDAGLLPGDAFWPVIEQKIRSSKAVIVVWSRPALTSFGVRAEAQLALDLKRLVSVRTDDVLSSEIQLPFNAIQQCLVSDRQKIYSRLDRLGASTSRPEPTKKLSAFPILASDKAGNGEPIRAQPREDRKALAHAVEAAVGRASMVVPESANKMLPDIEQVVSSGERTQSLNDCLAHAYLLARSTQSATIGLEHLLYALADDEATLEVFERCGTSARNLKRDCFELIRLLPGDALDSFRSSDELLRVLKVASSATRQSQRKEMDGPIVIAAIVGDGKSKSAGLLRSHGMSFDNVLRALQKS